MKGTMRIEARYMQGGAAGKVVVGKKMKAKALRGRKQLRGCEKNMEKDKDL